MPIQTVDGSPQSIEIWPCSYHSRCSTGGCRHLARVIVRRIAPGNTPNRQSEHCDEHMREAIKKARRAGMPVRDMR
jgi:hypothetical protein